MVLLTRRIRRRAIGVEGLPKGWRLSEEVPPEEGVTKIRAFRGRGHLRRASGVHPRRPSCGVVEQ